MCLNWCDAALRRPRSAQRADPAKDKKPAAEREGNRQRAKICYRELRIELLLAGVVDLHRLHFALTAILEVLKGVMIRIDDL
jgi:hypothetical protein